MRFSLSILFLGLWLTGQWRMSRGQGYPKPSILVRSREVALGGTITIGCKNNDFYAKDFSLYKEEGRLLYTLRIIQTNEAVFQIANANRLDGGRYLCSFCYVGYNKYYCSKNSSTIDIKVIGQLHPKPSITVSPSEAVAQGQTVNIRCRSEGYQKALFYLYVQRDSMWYSFSLKMAAGSEAVFPLTNIKLHHAGTYRCQYCFQSDFYDLCSNYSDQAHINVRDLDLSKPSIKVKPKEPIFTELNITIECHGPENGLNFSLYKSSHLIASQTSEPNRNATEFLFFMVGLEDAGNYTCQYHRKRNLFVWSEQSDPVELVVREMSQQTGSVTLLWTSIAAGLLLLLLLLLLLVFVLCRKRRKGSTAPEGNQPMTPPIELKSEIDEISYAELSHYSKQAADPDRDSETCVYAIVAHNKTRESQ